MNHQPELSGTTGEAVETPLYAPREGTGKVPHQPGPPASERDLWSGRTHWHSSMGRVVFWFLLNVAVLVGAIYVPRTTWLTTSRLAWIVIGFFLVTAVLMLGGIAIRVLQTRYRLTTQRLFIERGIFSRTMDQTELIRVDDVRMQQTFINRIFRIGTVSLMTTDLSDRSMVIFGIKDPVRVTELVRQQMRTLRGKSVFVETL